MFIYFKTHLSHHLFHQSSVIRPYNFEFWSAENSHPKNSRWTFTDENKRETETERTKIEAFQPEA